MPNLQPFHSPLIRAAASALGLILRLGALSCIIGISQAETVKLAWNPNPEPNIAGYKLHYWTQDGGLPVIIDVGSQTSAAVSDLAPSTTYYFAVQAYNTLDMVSRLSAPVSYTTKALWALALKGRGGVSLPEDGGSVNLGFVNLGAISDTYTFSITNKGLKMLTNISFSLDGPGAGRFLATGNLPHGSAGQSSGLLAKSLAPGKSITLSLIFQPTSDGLRDVVLRLSAAESEGPLFAVKLSASGSARFDTWLADKGLSGGASGNSDGDALNNLQEYAFGTDPKAAQGRVIGKSESGITRGTPSVRVTTTPAFEMHGIFGRRKDHHSVGLRYLPQFSADLVTWVNAASPPLAEADDGEIELVSIKAPSIGGKPARFFRVGVAQAGPLTFPEWLGRFAAAGGMNGNPDGDALDNLQEYAFGTHPGSAQGRSVEETGGLLASRGAPNVRVTTSPEFQFRGLFGRRIGHASLGLIYRPQFSADLVNWVDAGNAPVKIADDGEMEVVSVLAPAMIDGKPARFFRVGVSRKLVHFDDWLAVNAPSKTDGAPTGLMEYAFGLDQGIARSSFVEESDGILTSRGMPAARVITSPEFQFRGLFGRRIGHVSLGLAYRPQFSADLVNWVDAGNAPVKLTDDGEIEVVSVRAPAMIDGKPARFFRVGVSQAP